MNTLIAACGLDCGKCEAYIATQTDDQAAQLEILSRWRVDYNAPGMPAEAVICDGCMKGNRHGGYCAECEVRTCCLERGLENCAYCADFACQKLEGFFQMASEVHTNLEAIRQGL